MALRRGLRGVVTRGVTHGQRGDRRHRPERGADPLAGDRRVGVPVELADQRPAVRVAELLRDDVVGELEEPCTTRL